MTNELITVTATAPDGTTYRRQFTGGYIYPEGGQPVHVTARQQADNYAAARRDAGCTTTETTTWEQPK